MEKLIARIKCAILTGHEMEYYQSKIVDGLFGKVAATRRRCVDCFCLEKYWIVKEKGRPPIRYD